MSGNLSMRRLIFGAGFILLCIVYAGDVGAVICRLCNLSIPFHGCLLDFGTCKTKPGQFCITEVHIKGGIQWYEIKGCTENVSECFQRAVTAYEMRTSHCCSHPMCNF